MKILLLPALAAALACGCSSNKTAVKAVHERAWIGGTFETVPTPKAARERKFAKTAPLITSAPSETPLAKAGLREGDLALAVNGRNLRLPKSLNHALEKAGADPLSFTIYRDGEITDVKVVPGVERYQHLNTFAIAIGLSPNLDIDLCPNPNFSLVALGFKEEPARLDLRGAKGKYLAELQAREDKPAADSAWQGLRTDEHWNAWLGPFHLSRHKVIVSQEAAKKLSRSFTPASASR